MYESTMDYWKNMFKQRYLLKTYFGPDMFFNSIKNYSCSTDFEVLEGWKSSGRPAEKKSTKPGTCTPPWCRVADQNPKKTYFGCHSPRYLLILYTQYLKHKNLYGQNVLLRDMKEK